MKITLVGLFLLFSLAASAAAATFVVDSTVDPGDGVCGNPGCTLREAITSANANPGADTIVFSIFGVGVKTITPTSALPSITEAVTIDGYTQSGAAANTLAVGDNAVLTVELNGTAAGAVTGLILASDDSVIRGLVINRFGFGGIIVNSSGAGNVIEGNFIGTDAAGTADLGNAVLGVAINTGNGNLIGGALAAARNLISGNGGPGGLIFGVGASDNLFQGNYIGTDRNGTAALPNDGDGILISFDAESNDVGGTATGAGNLISGNGRNGVYITDFDGGSPGGSNTVQGNLIGTDATGTAALGNIENGVFVENRPDNTIGGTVAGAGNVISGNGLANSLTSSNGILIMGEPASGNLVQGNFIGTDISGSIALENVTEGVHIFDAPDNIVGGTIAGARNIISGNNFSGVRITSDLATGNLVQGNYIGTDAAGSADLGNSTGVTLAAPDNILGGSVAGAGNVISGNGFGVQVVGMTATGNRIQGNRIGTDATGTAPLGNSLDGVLLFTSSTDTTVGGPAGAGNIIAFNSPGVSVLGNPASTGNSIFGNSIFSNDGLGIDLADDGVTANDFPDSDAGANELQNYPVLNEITLSGTSRTVEGELNSNPNTDYVIDFYRNREVDPSGFGEGETYLGFLNVQTNAQGVVLFTFPLEADALGQFITATATDSVGNTSEFSMASAIVPPISRFLNISTRLRVQTGDNVLIGGFIITGNDPKQVIVRAIGPSLGDAGVADPLANPTLELNYPDGSTVVTNNDWRDTQEAEILASGLAPNDDLESAILATLDPGAYTAIVRGVNEGTGVALVETYDLSSGADSALANISTRGLVETGDNVMIGGIIVGPDTAPSSSILLRGIGPSLGEFGITNPLLDPLLELRDLNGVLVMANDNWKSTQQTAIEATGLAPNDDLEAAILATLAAGNYTAIMSGVGGTTGIGLVEAYHLE